MVDYETYMSIALVKCATTGRGTAKQRQETFSEFARLWTAEKEQIKEMTEAELRDELNCP